MRNQLSMTTSNFIMENNNHCFDVNLVELIKEKNNSKLQTILNGSRNLCTAFDSSGTSLLHYAAEFGNETMTKYLIKHGSKVNTWDRHRKTPLVLATKARHRGVIRILLERGANIDSCDETGRSALHIAIHTSLSHAKITRMFIIQVIRDNSLVVAKAAKKLLDVDCPIYKAVLLKNMEQILSLMVTEGSSIDAKDPTFGMTALHVAVERLEMGNVEFLLSAGANVNAQDNCKQTPIAMLTEFSHRSAEKWKIARMLIEKGAVLTSCTDVGVMQMYWMVRYGNREGVTMLVEANVDFSARDNYGQTPLHYLARNGNSGVVAEMRDVKIDVDARDKNGMTALHIGMAVGNLKFVEFLVKKGAQVDVQTNGGFTPIFQTFGLVVTPEIVKCVKLLLKHGADPELEIQCYFSMYDTDAAVNRDLLILKLLLTRLVIHETQGKMKNSGDVFSRIELYPNLKEYVDKCREKLMKETVALTDVTNKDDMKKEKDKKKKKKKMSKSKKNEKKDKKRGVA